MRYLIVSSLSLCLAACATQETDDFPRMANLQWYEGHWQSEDGNARQSLARTAAGYRGELWFLQDGTWVLASQGGCAYREVPVDGWYAEAQFWDCDYYPANGVEMGFERLNQSAYTATSYDIPGLDPINSGSIFINIAIQGETETTTYEHWTRPADGRFSYQIWQTGESGALEPWFSGTWIRREAE